MGGVAANFNDSTSLDSADFNAMNALALSHGEIMVANAERNGFGFVAVPEPVSIAMLGVKGMAVLARRGGRRNANV